jgi:predicted GNAT family acetyltransferase
MAGRQREPRAAGADGAVPLTLSSALPSEYRGVLEALLYFNPLQSQARERILASLERFGNPLITEEAGRLHIGTDRIPRVQAMYALGGEGTEAELVGAILYMRDQADSIAILHVAVQAEYSASGSRGEGMVAMRMINAVRDAASRIKGVCSVRLFYSAGGVAHLPVRGSGRKSSLS